MHSVRIQKVVTRLISIFYFIGLWHRGHTPTPRELRTKLLYYVYYSIFFVVSVLGAYTNETGDVAVFLTEASIAIGVWNIKLWVLLWKQNEILELMNETCFFSVRYDDDFEFVNGKLRRFAKVLTTFFILISLGCIGVILIPFIGSEKTLFMEIWFPLDYKNSAIAFWIAHTFIVSHAGLSAIGAFSSILVWYLLLTCSLRYEVLGSELKKIGRAEIKTSKKEKCRIFVQDMRASIDDHLHIRGLTNKVELFFSNIFFVQLGTSGLCICGSIYCLAFDVGDNSLLRCVHNLLLIYFISDLFMITYFGNEITVSSNRLSYSIFESDWTEQLQATKKCLIVFGEYLKQPQELLIGKLYPLTLETFTKILNSAYSMFNILKSFQK